MPILVKGVDIRSGTKTTARKRRLRAARGSMGSLRNPRERRNGQRERRYEENNGLTRAL